MAFAPDDVYSMGFKNLSGDWHTLSDFHNIVSGGSTKLPFGHSYPALLPPPPPGTNNDVKEENAHLRLITVRLGREATATAFNTLAYYNPSTTPVPEVQSAVLTLSVTFGEGLRFAKFNKKLVDHWEDEAGVFMSLQEAQSVVLYGLVCHQLDWWWGDGDPRKSEWRRDWLPELRSIDADSAKKALDTVLVLLRYRPGEKERSRRKGGRGKPPSPEEE
ncbi:hypothetical protein ACQ4PT_022262 [Festuca glaucescens]